MDNLINLFNKGNSNYDKVLQFGSIIIFIIVLVLFSKIFDKNIIFLVLFALIFSEFYVKVNKSDLNDENKLILYKLNSLQEKIYEFINYRINLVTNGNLKLSSQDKKILFEKNKLDSLYIDSDIIEFLYSILKLYDYNQDEFYLLVKGTNNILKLRKEIENFYISSNDIPINTAEMIENAIILKRNCMNNLQNFIYKVPKIKKMYMFIDKSIEVYNILISRNIYIMNYIYKIGKNKEINIMTKFINLNEIKPIDELNDYSPVLHKKSIKLVELYN